MPESSVLEGEVTMAISGWKNVIPSYYRVDNIGTRHTKDPLFSLWFVCAHTSMGWLWSFGCRSQFRSCFFSVYKGALAVLLREFSMCQEKKYGNKTLWSSFFEALFWDSLKMGALLFFSFFASILYECVHKTYISGGKIHTISIHA